METAAITAEMGKNMENKKEDKKRKRGLPTQTNLVIHIVAGAYLLYLACTIYGGIGAAVGGERIVSGLAIILFAVTGLVSVFSALRSLKSGEYRGGAADPDRGEGENGTEGAGENAGRKPEQRRIRFDETDAISEERKSIEKKEEKE